ncbi:MAG TPA: thioredoxin domain-containing protein [Polyangiales bacterium]
MTANAPANRLANETSPYLLQHAHNPVDWYPWGAEALERARTEQKPIFLSIGYSACHWCHVMERECFENPEIAQLMNELYVNIKVDREERPDVDEIYMKAVLAMTGSGGWPMSMFLTPSLQPFFGATYLPPVRAYGRPSFPDVLTALAQAWQTERDRVVEQASLLTAAVSEEASVDARGTLDASALTHSLDKLKQSFDAQWGGFGGAPKFPHSGDLRLLLRHALRSGDAQAQTMAVHTLERMADGGIYDQLGGGFHRYSVDRQWRVPHFEKMLYDNAQLVVAYLEAHVATGNPRFAQIAAECCDWALREMQTSEGGFASAQDADSEGEEGQFFAWTPAQLRSVLGDERGRAVAAWFDVTDQGNFEHGKSVLWMPVPRQTVAQHVGIPLPELRALVDSAKPELLAARARRVHPATDDKVLAAWNGLMIGALAQAYQVLEDPLYLDAAQRAARYVLDGMRQPDGRLFATARHGRAHINACLDDYAFVAQGLIDLYEASFDERWLREALALTELVETRFADRERGGYFTTGAGHEALITRCKSVQDGALPAGSAVHALSLLRLAELTARPALLAQAHAAVDGLAKLALRHPQAFSHLLIALDFRLGEPRQIVIAGDASSAATQSLLRCVRRTFRPQRVVTLATPGSDTTLLPVLAGKTAADQSRAYVCQRHACQAPTQSADELQAALRNAVAR